MSYVYIFLLQTVNGKIAKPLKNQPIGRARGCVNIQKDKPNVIRPKMSPSLTKNIQTCDTNKLVLSEKPTKVRKGFVNEYYAIFI